MKNLEQNLEQKLDKIIEESNGIADTIEELLFFMEGDLDIADRFERHKLQKYLLKKLVSQEETDAKS